MTKARHTVLACLLLAVIILGTGCATGFSNFRFDSGNKPSNIVLPVVTASGEMTTKDYDAQEFTHLSLIANDGLSVQYRTGEPSLRLTMPKNLFNHVSVDVSAGKASVAFDQKVHLEYKKNQKPQLIITTPGLDTIDMQGGLQWLEGDVLQSKTLAIMVAGAVAGKMGLEAEELTVNVQGAADLEISGTADSAIITLSGASDINAKGLATQEAAVVLNGASSTDITCERQLNATINGAGVLNYWGDAKVSKNINGMGFVNKK